MEKEVKNTVRTRKPKDFRFFLQSEFTNRCRKNPRYSLRAFSQLLKMDPSSVSQILSGKRQASVKVINHICMVLGSAPQDRDSFIRKSKEKVKKSKFSIPAQDESYELLAEDAFAIISDWYHFAILELINVDGFISKPYWCARALGISTSEAQIAIERMLRFGILHLENERIIRGNKQFTNFLPGMTSSAHKNLQKQILQMAINAIDNSSADEKDITAMTMAIDTKKIPEARKLIAKFRRDLSAFMEDGEQTRVYQLGIQLYPVSKEMNGDLK